MTKTRIRTCQSQKEESSPYVDLTPISDADPDGRYTEALNFALENDQVKNIAVTGPYGSGKSSVINTFEKNSSYNVLSISLASFGDEKVGDILIERSILQQMFYGSEANKLPFSRFKKISIPEWTLAKSALFFLWVLILTFLYQNKEAVLHYDIYSTTYWVVILLISLSVSVPIVLGADIYKSVFGFSLKKLSLTNAEIEIDGVPEKSILNKYLDEIIYFFQVTEYDIVVIEDLDRFGSPEIFVKLREINKLINDNDKTSGKIKFIYALKDDMFANADRAKFFDFIIPIVPIVNSSNSLDKMHERLKNEAFPKSVDPQFLREVSLYIYDMRLIHNVFNEFLIYQFKLGSDQLNKTKLLAMMIYKNVYPEDFENLHNGKGALYEICQLRPFLINEIKKELTRKVVEIKKNISNSKAESAKSVKELIQLFIGLVVSHSDNHVSGIYINNTTYSFPQLLDWEIFQQLFLEENIKLIAPHPGYAVNQNQNQSVPLNKSFKQLESELDNSFTIAERKEFIANKAVSSRRELQLEIDNIEKISTSVSQLSLNQLILQSDISVEDILTENEIEKKELLTYLINEGCLDETYHLYISNFHEGRMTQKDRDFLLTIRNFGQPDPKQQIDTPKEICENMRSSDFSHKYVLNVNLVDYLIDNKGQDQYQNYFNNAISFISRNFEESVEFLMAYREIGSHSDVLIREISRQWPAFAAEITKTHQAPIFLSMILKYVQPDFIEEKMNSKEAVTSYLAENGHLIYAADISAPENYSILKLLNVKFKSVDSIKQNRDLLDFVHFESLYEINSKNIGLLLETFSGTSDSDWKSANYSTLCSDGSGELKQYINENLSKYIENVFLPLPQNSKEELEYIRRLLVSGAINNDLKEQIISKQEYIFSTFDDIPKEFWTHVFLEEKVKISWIIISEYLKYTEDEEGEDEKEVKQRILIDALNQEATTNCLTKDKGSIKQMVRGDKLPISNFIRNNDKITEKNYNELIKCLPYTWDNFPSNVSNQKCLSLASEQKVTLNAGSFSFAEDNDELLAILIRENLSTFLKQVESYPITDRVREKLLSFDITNDKKINIAHEIKFAGIEESDNLAHLFADLLLLPNVDISGFDNDIIQFLVVHARSEKDSIRLLAKCISRLNKMDIISTLDQFPRPYNKIASFGKRPTIPLTDENLIFAKKLKERGIITDSKIEKDKIRINTFRKRFVG